MAAGVAAGGKGLEAVGAIMQGQQTAQALNYNANVQQNNAYAALASAKLNADKQSNMANRVMGEAKAAYGASGVESDSGSVFAVMGASAANAELDRQNVLYGGQVRATNYLNQAALDRSSAAKAISGSYLNALAAITGGAADAFGNFKSAKADKEETLKSGDMSQDEEGYDQVNSLGSDATTLDSAGGAADAGASDLALA